MATQKEDANALKSKLKGKYYEKDDQVTLESRKFVSEQY